VKAQTWKLLAKIHTQLGNAATSEAATKRAEEVERVRNQLSHEIEAV